MLLISVSDETATSAGLLVGNSGAITFNDINVERGLLKVSGGAAAASGAVHALNTLSVGDADVAAQQDLDKVEAVIEIAGGSVVGDVDTGSDIDKSTKINILNNGKIEFTGATGTLQGGALTVNGGAIEVDGNGSGGTVSIAQGTMTNGQIKVGSGSTLTLNLTQLKKNNENVDMFFNAQGGVIDVDGTLKLQGGTSSGAALYDFSFDGLTLTSTGENVTGTPTIEVSGAATNSAVLKISTSNLEDFLTTSSTLPESSHDNSGSVDVKANGVLEFSDDVTLNDYEFSGSAAGGKIVVAQSAEVRATNLTIDDQVSGGDTFSGSLVATNLNISTSSFKDASSGANLANASKVTVYEDFNSTATNFALDAAVQLGKNDKSTDPNSTVQDTTPGTFEAVNLTITSADLTIKGDYSFDASSITVSGATVKVGDGEYANVSFKTNSGNLEIENKTANTFTVSGDSAAAPATLDFTGVNLSVTDTAALTKFNASGNGIIKFNSDDLVEIATGDQTATSGAAVIIYGDGKVISDGNTTLNVKNLVSAEAGNASGNSITFVSGANATLEVQNGTLTLESESNAKLNIGSSGAIVADALVVDANGSSGSSAVFEVSGGQITVLGDISAVEYTTSIKFDGANTNSTLTLGKADVETEQSGTIKTNLTFSGSSGSLTVNDGTWDLQGVLTLEGGAQAIIGETGTATEEILGTTFSADQVNVVNGTLTVNAQAEANIDALAASSTSANVNVKGGYLTITGANYADTENASTYGDYGVKTSGATISVSDHGTLYFAGNAAAGMFNGEAKFTTEDETTTVNFNSGDYAQVSVTSGAILKIDNVSAGILSMDVDDYVALKKAVLTSSTLNGDNLIDHGWVDLGDVTLDEYAEAINPDTGHLDYSLIKDYGDLFDLKNKQSSNTVADIDDNEGVAGNHAALNLTGNATAATIIGNTALDNAAANTINGEQYFVSTKDGTAGGATVSEGVELELNNGGIIGKVELKSSDAAATEDYPTTLTVNNGSAETETIIREVKGDATNVKNVFQTLNGKTTVQGEVTAGVYKVGGTDVVEGNITTTTLDVAQGGSLTAEAGVDTSDLTIAAGAALLSEATSDAKEVVDVDNLNVAGLLSTTTLNVTASADDAAYVSGVVLTKDLNVNMGTGSSETFQVAEGGAVAVTGTLNVVSGSVVVGQDAVEAVGDEEAIPSSNGYLYAETLILNGNEIAIDPDYTVEASVGAFNNLKDAPAAGEAYEGLFAGTLDGDFTVGQNGIGLIGVSLEDAEQYVNYVKALDGVDSALLLNKSIKVDNNTGNYQIVIDSTRSLAEIDDAKLDSTDPNYSGYYDADLVLEDNSALVVTANAIEAAEKSVDDTSASNDAAKAVVEFVADATIGSLGGEIIIADGYDVGDTINLFRDGGTQGDHATDVLVEGTDALVVRSVNGLLTKTYKSGDYIGAVDLDVDLENARSILNRASTPVFNTLLQYAARDLTPADELKEGDALISSRFVAKDVYDNAENKDAYELADDQTYAPEGYYTLEARNALLENDVKAGNGSATESAARLAVYGGAVQAAMAANASSYEAIATRMGMGNQNSVLTYANNADGAGIWLAPVYKNHDSDGFDAQGVDYGVDMDLYGVALGADFTFAQHFRAGAMFNVGSGDADGKGAGSAVSNDFDYWGASIYGGFAYENFSITADIGYTSVDNDIDASTGLSDVTKLSASTDTEAWTVGLTAQYKFELSALDITPHVGARFTRIDMDDYSVGSNLGTVAEFDADSMNVFSIPVGVTFSKDITAGDWSVMPSLDLTVTANTGDDELDGDVSWSGISNLTTATSTEVLDDFTYGANLGISATNGAFSFGLGVNYVGSDNADEFGVQANARFTF